MKTQSELLNEQAGCQLFATEYDIYGLPVNGWSMPCLTIKENEFGNTVAVLGVLRIVNGTLTEKVSVECYIERTLSIGDDRDAFIELARSGMIDELITGLKPS